MNAGLTSIQSKIRIPAWRHAMACLLAAVAGAALVGCATRGAPEPAATASLTTPDWAPGRDLRPAYRQALCSRLPAGADCTQVLPRLSDEAPAPKPAAAVASAATLAQRYRLVFIPGLLAGCGGSLVVPFQDVVDALRAQGFDARILAVEGRASSEQNADLIAGQLAQASNDPRPQIVFGYSKGLPDMLETLVRHPGAARHVAAVVSYAGAAGGTRLADDMGRFQQTLLEHLPLTGCQPGDGAEIRALRRNVRHAWWQANHARLHVPFYSLVALPGADRISAPLRGTHAELARSDPHNDGQLVAADAIVPGSALLGYVNADHWAIAIPLSQQLPLLRGLFTDDVPRTQLVLAAVQVIDQQSSRQRP